MAVSLIDLVVIGLALLLVVALMTEGGWKILARWRQEPVSIAVMGVLTTVVFLAPQMDSIFAAVGTSSVVGVAFYAISMFWMSWMSWYWQRAALNLRNKLSDTAYRAALGRDGLDDWADKWASRLTLLPGFLICIAPAVSMVTGKQPQQTYVWFAVALGVASQVLVWWLSVLRHRGGGCVARILGGGQRDITSNWQLTNLFSAAVGGRRFALATFTSVVLMFGFLGWAPARWTGTFTTATLVYFAVGSLIGVATVLLALTRDAARVVVRVAVWLWRKIGFGKAAPVPPNVRLAIDTLGIVLLLLVPVVGNQINYCLGAFDIDDGKPMNLQPRRTIDDALTEYARCHAPEKFPDGKVPLIIVASAGGASRSAAWTLSVMRHLDEQTQGAFGSHIFLLTGVSGGSLGVTSYAMAHKRYVVESKRASEAAETQRVFWQDSRTRNGSYELAQADLLGPTVARLFTRDLLLGSPSRAAVLEQSFEGFWSDRTSFDLPASEYGKPFGTLANDAPCLPHLILNGTAVNGGWRMFTTTLDLSSLDNDSYDIQARRTPCRPSADEGNKLLPICADPKTAKPGQGWYDITPAQAVLNSARFPLISPAGDVQHNPRVQVVDGGVFENNAARTSWDIAQEIKIWNGGHKSDGITLEPIFVMITNDAELKEFEYPDGECIDQPVAPPDPRSDQQVKRGANSVSTPFVIPDFLTSPLGLFASRGGHAAAEMHAIRTEYCRTVQAPKKPTSYFLLDLIQPVSEFDETAPMSWLLDTFTAQFMYGRALTAKSIKTQTDQLSKRLNAIK